MIGSLFGYLSIPPEYRLEVCMAVIALATIPVGIHGVHRLRLISHLLRHGIRTQGCITRLSRFARLATCLYYDDKGHSHKIRIVFYQRKVSIGESVDIIYHPEQPQEAIAPASGHGKPRAEALCDTGICCVTILFFILSFFLP